eukprot:scaffold29403_cov130-Isochrysis_galbana.AAC.4
MTSPQPSPRAAAACFGELSSFVWRIFLCCLARRGGGIGDGEGAHAAAIRPWGWGGLLEGRGELELELAGA